ncbi:hypothetical protein TrST_g12157 [Triparma strigata]|uniref:Endonuclease/exonuclease/phosphatase domain-containing protein n=1 Tax=Triparma strigata TaxID=1606541 RepID=A0A9W7AY79_9STRA|nr:hypothetical protein TrST_g12157 [Triparma strigata]
MPPRSRSRSRSTGWSKAATKSRSSKSPGRKKSPSRSSTKSSRSRSASRPPAPAENSVRVLTFNIRGFFDRFNERCPFMLDTITRVNPNVACFQECMVNNAGVDKMIAKSLSEHNNNSPYSFHSDASIVTNIKEYGTQGTDYDKVTVTIFSGLITAICLIVQIPIIGSILARLPLLLEKIREITGQITGVDIFSLYYVFLGPFFGISCVVDEKRCRIGSPKNDVLVYQPFETKTSKRLHLGTAQRIKIMGQDNKPLFWIVNIHYCSITNDVGKKIREEETQRVLDWMEPKLKETGGRVVIVGDHNTLMKKENVCKLYEKAGYSSAYKKVHGAEPKSTWPSGLKAIYMDVDGPMEGVCLDFIWTKGNLSVSNAGLAGDIPHKDDETLYPSDHVGIWADVEVS